MISVISFNKSIFTLRCKKPFKEIFIKNTQDDFECLLKSSFFKTQYILKDQKVTEYGAQKEISKKEHNEVIVKTHKAFEIQTKAIISKLIKFPTPMIKEDIQVEEHRSHEWLKTTCDFLKGSTLKSIDDPRNYIDSFVHIKSTESLCIKVFNLEFLLVILENSIKIQVFDYGNNHKKEIKFNANFSILYKQAFDEILKLLIFHNKLVIKNISSL